MTLLYASALECATSGKALATSPTTSEDMSGGPVLPDFDRWANHYTLITFDSDPTCDHETLATLLPEQRRSMAGMPPWGF